MDDLVTIAIPTYNRANLYLRDVISAALDQTWENIEVLVGDNASTDNTDKVVSEFKDPRLRYIQHKNNIGANGNFNALLNAAKGKWFFLFHDDDMIDGDFIESQAFAYLAIRSYLKLPISFPETTGCNKPCTGGEIIMIK